MANTYNVRVNRGTILRAITERQRFVTAGNVVLHGRGAKNYHYDRNQNLVYKLENFAGSPAPSDPFDGMLWWDIPNEQLLVYNEFGSPNDRWQSVVPPGAGVGFGVVPGDGLEQTGSPVSRNYEPAGSPLTLELQVKTGNTGLFNIVAVGSLSGGSTDMIWTSQDGVDWTQRSRAAGAPLNHVRAAFSPTLGRFVITHQTRHVSYSDDGGETWNYQTNAFPVSGGGAPNYEWTEIEWIDSYGLFVATNLTSDSDEERLAYSADGLSWTLVPVSVFASQPTTRAGYSKIVYIDSLDIVAIFCTGPSNNQPNAAHIVWTRDGINWKLQQNIATLAAPWSVWTGQLFGFTYSDTLDQLMYIGNSGSNGTRVRPYTFDVSAAGSPLFATGWTLQTSSPTWPEYARYNDAEWFGGTTNRFVFVGADTNNTTLGSPDPDLANVIYSDTGTTFEMTKLGPPAPSGTTPEFNRARYVSSLDTMFIGTGYFHGGSPALGLIWSSTNGKSWTRSSALPGATSLTSIQDIASGETVADGVTVSANSISINTSEVSHDSLAGFVSSEHVDHSDVILTGDGMIEVSLVPIQIGSLAASRTLNINDGSNIIANANDVQVGSSVIRMTGDTFTGTKTFLTPKGLQVGDGGFGNPSLGFSSTGVGTGMFRTSGLYDFGFACGYNLRFFINESNGRTLRSAIPGYEILVTDDDDIPNKEYVDNLAGSAGTGAVTQNVFASRSSYTGSNVALNHVFTCSISGLTPGKKYLVTVTGITRVNGTGSGTFGGIRVTSTHANPPTGGLLYAGPLMGVNWPDGNHPQHSMCVITAPAGGTIYGYCDYRDNTPPAIEWMNAYYMTATQID